MQKGRKADGQLSLRFVTPLVACLWPPILGGHRCRPLWLLTAHDLLAPEQGHLYTFSCPAWRLGPSVDHAFERVLGAVPTS